MLIPSAVHELDEAHAAFEQPPGDEAVVGKGALGQRVGAVALDDVFGLAGEIEQVRHAGLHLVGHFVLRDARVDLRVAVVREVRGVHRLEVVEQGAALLAAHAGRVVEVGHERAGVAEAHALVAARQKAAAPVVVEESWPQVLPLSDEVMATNAGRSVASQPSP